jgi:hypothetical protein
MTRIPRLLWGDPASRSMFPDLDAAYRRQLETMSRVRRAIAAVATSRKKLELRLDQLAHETGTPEGEAVSESEEVRRQHRDGTRRPADRRTRVRLDLDAGLADLQDVGSAAGATVSKALATIGSRHGTVVVASSPADLGRPGRNIRL